MAEKDVFQRYLEAGIEFTNLTRARAEKLVSELMRDGEFRSEDARAKVDELLEQSRKRREAFVAQVRQEVSRQLEHAGITSLEDLARQVAALLQRTAEAGRATASGAKKAPAKKASAKKASAKKAPAKKASAKKTTAKKAAAKKTPARKAAAGTAARKAPAKEAAHRAAPRDGSAG